MALRHVSLLKDHPQGVQRMAPQRSQHTPATVLLPQHRN